MMFEELKKRVCEANLCLESAKLVKLTWGNVSGIDREKGIVAIKPSGVPYSELTPDKIVLTDLCGKVIEGTLRPSSDLATHLVLYNAFDSVGGITHTHSSWATVFSQAGKEIVPLGTTHADAFPAPVPVTREMTDEEIRGEYEKETGNVIVERFRDIDPKLNTAVLVRSHAPFTWGASPEKSVECAIILEEVAMTAYHTLQLGGKPMQRVLLEKHFYRKHGKNAYYGQK